jgi:molybdopterin synthase catalytic subunit
LLPQVTSIRFDLDDRAYHRMLGEISESEDAQGRGMLSAIVVHKTGDQEPGKGFYELAAQLGRNTVDPLKCWIDEMKLIHDVWANQRVNIQVIP